MMQRTYLILTSVWKRYYVRIPCRDGQLIDVRLYQSVKSLEAAGPMSILLYFQGGRNCVIWILMIHYVGRSVDMLHVACRLVPEFRFPTAVYDAQDAYQ